MTVWLAFVALAALVGAGFVGHWLGNVLANRKMARQGKYMIVFSDEMGTIPEEVQKAALKGSKKSKKEDK